MNYWCSTNVNIFKFDSSFLSLCVFRCWLLFVCCIQTTTTHGRARETKQLENNKKKRESKRITHVYEEDKRKQYSLCQRNTERETGQRESSYRARANKRERREKIEMIGAREREERHISEVLIISKRQIHLFLLCSHCLCFIVCCLLCVAFKRQSIQKIKREDTQEKKKREQGESKCI